MTLATIRGAGRPASEAARVIAGPMWSATASGPVHTVTVRLEQLLGQAQQEGTLRPDIPPREVAGLLNVAVCRPGARADDHLTTVILDGLKR